MGKPFIDRTGFKYGKLTVVKFLGKTNGKTKATWGCHCDCGNSTEVTSSNLATGHTTSCGCQLVAARKENRKYAVEDKIEYGAWRSMKQRTGKRPGKNSQWYSEVTLCPSWEHSFDTFLRDMGKKPSSQHSIERLDNSKGYSRDNCVWATPKEQANNRSTNLVLDHEGQSLTAAQWAERVDLKHTTLTARLRRGWDIATTLTAPLHTRINDVSE